MKNIILFLAAVSFLAVTSCSTMHGLGRDVEKAGTAISDSADRAVAE